MAKYIEFDEVMPPPKGIWVIRNKRSDTIIGKIEWYSPWRRYVADFEEGSIWSEDCLQDIRQFILSKQNA